MKKGEIFLKATIASAVTSVVFMLIAAIVKALSEVDLLITAMTRIPPAAWVAASVPLMLIFVLLYVLLFHVRGGGIKKSLSGGEEYRGMAGDIVRLAKSEWRLILTVLLINLGCWALLRISFLLGRRFLTTIITIIYDIYTPLNPLGVAFVVNDVLACVCSSVMVYVLYVLTLAAARKITYNKMYPKNKT